MNNISTKAALFLFDAKSKFGKAKDYLGRKAKSIVKEENGDTNFISIIINYSCNRSFGCCCIYDI